METFCEVISIYPPYCAGVLSFAIMAENVVEVDSCSDEELAVLPRPTSSKRSPVWAYFEQKDG